jgi:type I restriction enzyme S subunit
MEHIEAHTMKLLGTVPAGTMKSSAVYFQPGDVLYGRLRPYLNKVYRPDFEGLCSAEFIVFPKTEGVDSRYLQYFLNSSAFVSFASHLNTGDRPRVDFDQLAPYEFPLAPLDQQKHIVAEIEKQFSRLDEAVANLKRVKANLKRYKAAVLKAAVEGRLVETEAELARREGRSYETGAQLLQRILETRRSQWKGKGKYKEPAAPDTSDLPELPEGWVWATVEQVSGLVEYGSSAKTSEDSNGIPVLRMGNIFEGELSLEDLKYLPNKHDEFPKLLLKPGDLLFNRTNSPELVGKTAVYAGLPQKCSFASYLIRVRLTQGGAPNFLAAYINSAYGRNWVKSVVTQQVGQANVNGSKLQALNVPLPPEAEQQRIVAEIDRRLSLIREVEAQVDANLARAERLRQTILARAFSGRLVGVIADEHVALLQQVAL